MNKLEYSRLIGILENPPPVPRPIILPDFFLDHFIIADELEDLVDSMMKLAKQGGGNLLGHTQFIKRGGNAVNTASALLSLGLDPQVIITTDEYGASILRSLVSPNLDLGLVHTDGRMSTTVSIEAEYKKRRVNLMISDSGSASEFSFSDLTESDLAAIRDSGLIALVNLNHNRHAVDLAESLFEMVRDTTNAITFIDIGDPSYNQKIIEPLIERVLSQNLVDIVSMNENEAAWFAWAISGKNSRWRKTSSNPETWLSTAKYVAEETGVRIDFHTPLFSATLEKGNISVVPAFTVDCQVICGAGDTWNAGDIYGTLLKLDTRDRLILANTVAASYVSSSEAKHPSMLEVMNFLKGKIKTTDISDKLLNNESN